MIVRILGEGQWDLPDEHLDALNALDDSLEAAIEASDQDRFRHAMTALLDAVRQQGDRLEDDALQPSDLILPMADATLEEVRALLTDEGLVPD